MEMIPRGAIPMLGPTSIYHVETTVYMHLVKLTAIIVSYLFCCRHSSRQSSLVSRLFNRKSKLTQLVSRPQIYIGALHPKFAGAAVAVLAASSRTVSGLATVRTQSCGVH